MDCYLKHHIAAAKDSWGPSGMTSCVVCEITEDSEYAVKVIIVRKNLDSCEAVKNGKAARELAADVANFTDLSVLW